MTKSKRVLVNACLSTYLFTLYIDASPIWICYVNADLTIMASLRIT